VEAPPPVFRFLYGLAADARRLSRRRLLGRLVTGLANHYAATSCALFLGDGPDPVAAALPERRFEALAPEVRGRYRDLDRRLVARARERLTFASALELDRDGDVMDFLSETLALMDIFAFPLKSGRETEGAVVLYLSEDARPVGEADAQALMALGELVRLAREPGS
jgi:hypothetical protein